MERSEGLVEVLGQTRRIFEDDLLRMAGEERPVPEMMLRPPSLTSEHGLAPVLQDWCNYYNCSQVFTTIV